MNYIKRMTIEGLKKFEKDPSIENLPRLDIKDVKSMTEQELRGYDTSIQFIKDFEDGKVYPLDVFNNAKYIR